MDHVERVISRAGPIRIIGALGGLLVLTAVARWNPAWATGQPLSEQLIDFLLIGGPGLALLYAVWWFPRSGLRQDVYPRAASWCLGGLLGMLFLVGLMLFNPGGSADEPFWAMAVAGGLGAIGGLGIGIFNAQALSRAREAEEHRDRYRAERDLRERIVETSPTGISVTDADRSTRLVNERAADIVGLSKEELLTLEYDESMLETTDAEGNVLEDGVFEEVLNTGEAVYDAERQMTKPDGRRIWLWVNGAPLRDSSGEIVAVIFVVQDITERKRLEEELREAVANLERSNDRLRQFAYAASHDLQEPLRMVSTYLQFLDDRYRDDLDSEAQEYIGFAVDGADRMRAMVQDLLAYSRVEQSEASFESVECSAIVDRVLDDLTVQIEETDAEIVIEPLPTIDADEYQLEQLFQNLLTNALKYCDDAPRVEITAERRDDTWVFTVADNGIGIDPERTDQIFEVFKRLHTNGEYSGTGIGLSLCQKIVENHGGDIWVESASGEGSKFSFALPRRATTSQRPRSWR